MSNVSYYDVKYLIDETPCASLDNDWLESEFFQNYCYISEEILFELRDNNRLDFSLLVKNSIPVTYEILNKLQQFVMPQIGPIVDLYKNEGNGDALLIATALNMREKEDEKLVKCEWAIVTSDKGVATLAKKFDLRAISKKDFFQILKRECKTEQ